MKEVRLRKKERKEERNTWLATLRTSVYKYRAEKKY